MLQKVKDVVFVQVRNGAILFITGEEEDFYEIPLHAILKDWPHE
jgi:hypothetical protein